MPLYFSVTAPHYAGAIMINMGFVVAVTESTKYMIGWHMAEVLRYATHRGLLVEQIKSR